MTSTLTPELSTTASLTILKQDRAGRVRVRVPRERREALLDEFERSGLSGAKFAALCGVKYPSFAGWVSRRRRQRVEGGTPPKAIAASVCWLEALGPEPPGCPPLVLHLPGGGRMEIAAAAQAPLAAAVLRELSAAAGGVAC